MAPLLTRDTFRRLVFERDQHRCVFCHEREGLDAHHVIERRLWSDGGYYLDNGATVCQVHHLACERTDLTVEQVREAASITNTVLPEHLYPDQRYDKWGNPYLANGNRLPGELFEDESVRKALVDHLHEFQHEVKYPRTYHLPWSLGRTADDRTMPDLSFLDGQEVVVTEKLDGENTSLYAHTLHARSLEYAPRADRDRMKALHASIACDIPEGFHLCGENVWARHSIPYENLSTFFYAYGMWKGLTCLSWDESVEWFSLLGLDHVPVLFVGPFNEAALRALAKGMDPNTQEGYVVRLRRSFHMKDFPRAVGKVVRASHVRTQANWTRRIEPNGFAT